jgi:hypothetical protein
MDVIETEIIYDKIKPKIKPMYAGFLLKDKQVTFNDIVTIYVYRYNIRPKKTVYQKVIGQIQNVFRY